MHHRGAPTQEKLTKHFYRNIYFSIFWPHDKNLNNFPQNKHITTFVVAYASILLVKNSFGLDMVPAYYTTIDCTD